MSVTVEAVYENGVLKLRNPVPFQDHETVRVTIESAPPRATTAEPAADLARLLAHAGAVDMGKPTGAGNESIDADLAREYGASHEPGR
jgi:predicted DNA-binding antitoxin AbrB/MazE fold protein